MQGYCFQTVFKLSEVFVHTFVSTKKTDVQWRLGWSRLWSAETPAANQIAWKLYGCPFTEGKFDPNNKMFSVSVLFCQIWSSPKLTCTTPIFRWIRNNIWSTKNRRYNFLSLFSQVLLPFLLENFEFSLLSFPFDLNIILVKLLDFWFILSSVVFFCFFLLKMSNKWYFCYSCMYYFNCLWDFYWVVSYFTIPDVSLNVHWVPGSLTDW